MKDAMADHHAQGQRKTRRLTLAVTQAEWDAVYLVARARGLLRENGTGAAPLLRKMTLRQIVHEANHLRQAVREAERRTEE